MIRSRSAWRSASPCSRYSGVIRRRTSTVPTQRARRSSIKSGPFRTRSGRWRWAWTSSLHKGSRRGGHVAGEVSTLALVPRVVDAVSPRPVAAAGGIADARGLVAALALGAQAAVLGTRFLASTESRAHPHYKQKVLEAGEADTIRTILF